MLESTTNAFPVQGYLRGTHLRTPQGDVRIENLKAGDELLTASGAKRSVRWLGARTIDCSSYAPVTNAWPVCIRTGAFSQALPARDLWVSPDHELLIDGLFVQAGRLVNGVTVLEIPRKRVEYWHVELDRHDPIYAEGLAAESYQSQSDRDANISAGHFSEGAPNGPVQHPTGTRALLLQERPTLVAVRQKLIERAYALGYIITDDAQMHVVADGKRIDPMPLGPQRVGFLLSEDCQRIQLRCRTFIPAHVQSASTDLRELGICVGGLQLNGDEIPLEDGPTFGAGWFGLERNERGDLWRWAQSGTRFPPTTRLIVIDLYGRGYYWAYSLEAK